MKFIYTLCKDYEKSCMRKPHYPKIGNQKLLKYNYVATMSSNGNSYATTLYKYNDLINKISHKKIS